MKNNVIIIAIITLVAVLVIAVVIIAAVMNGSRESGESLDVSDFSGTGDSFSSEISDTSDNSFTENSSSDSSENSDMEDSSEVSEGTDEINLGKDIVALANSLIGVPFADNGDTPAGFDNSGFIYYVLRENGYITCPRNTAGQVVMGAALDYDDLNPGDLVFFSHQPGGDAGFGGIYAGDGKMIACLMPGTTVKEVDITTEYYRSNFVRGIGVS